MLLLNHLGEIRADCEMEISLCRSENFHWGTPQYTVASSVLRYPARMDLERGRFIARSGKVTFEGAFLAVTLREKNPAMQSRA